jgi:hypothetical protein
MSTRHDDKDWLRVHAIKSRTKITNEQIEQFCDRVEAAVNRDDEPRWVAREFEFKAMMGDKNEIR